MHKYPKDLVEALQELWPTTRRDKGFDHSVHDLPDVELLEDLISTCYQVSQMKEEDRDISFRMMFCEPHDFREESSTLFVLTFTENRPFNEYELTKLAPSVDYNNSLVGVSFDEKSDLYIWGLIHSGPQWADLIHGGSQTAIPLPPCLGINVVGPGRLTICHGLNILVQLSGGNIISPSASVFQSRWIKERFVAVQEKLFNRHRKNRHYNPEQWAKVDPYFVGTLYQEFFKHVISHIRMLNHGGLIISLPMEYSDAFEDEDDVVSVKYRFSKSTERLRMKTIILEIMASLAKVCGRLYGPEYTAGWKDYVNLRDEGMAGLDEQLFEFARFVASLASIDGAVIITEEPDIIGFGAMIQGTYEMGQSVAHALDPEGSQKQIGRIEGVGSRHRALFYFCSKVKDALGISISQDGKVRAVSWNNNIVTSWEIIPIDFS